MRRIFLFILLTGFFTNYFGQITTSINPSIAQMQALLQGNGVVVTGLNITCPAGAYATFNNGAAALGGGLNSGILLTTGSAANVAGPPSGFADTDNSSSGGGGSALGNSLSGGTTYDGCYINFLITPNCSTLSISYVFASEEYPEFVGSGVNDVFGFVISGQNPSGPAYNDKNIALVPGTANTAVSIDNVNAGTNSAYFVSNPAGLIYDGKTTVLSASCTVVPCQTYTMTIGVWDDGDEAYDSAVFLDVNGLSCVGNPTITATASPATICGTQSITLTAGGGIAGGTYTWSAPPSGGLGSVVTGPVITATPTGATTYTVSYSDMNTCPGVPLTRTTSVVFTPAPALPVSQSPAGAICAGQSVTLTASGGAGTYSWSPPSGLGTTSNSVTTASPTITTTYTVTKTVGTCVSSTVITVNVNALPTVTITPPFSTICSGQSVVLNASGSGPFVWTASSGGNPASVASVTVSPTTTTTYTVLSGAGTCTATAVATVSISTTPAITITPSLTIICPGQTATLSSSGAAPFVWTASSGAAPASAATVTVSPGTTTTYSVLSGAGTCTATAVATVSVSPPPVISITPSLSTICVGQSVTLTSTGPGPFAWTASSGAAPASVATVTVSPTTTTTYTVLSGTGTCTSSAVATVSISVTPAISITPSLSTICVGETATLTTTGIAPFVWTASSGSAPASAATVTVSPSTTTTYTVLSGAGTCTATAVATVSLSIPAAISITPSNTTICPAQSATLTSTGVGPFTWTASNGANPTSSATVVVSPTSTTTYSVISGTGSCTVAATATVDVTVVNGSISASSTYYCPGVSPVTLIGGGATSYTWTGINLSATSGATVTATPTAATVYTVTGEFGSCTATKTVSINVPAITTITATSTNTFICTGNSATLTATGAVTYTWMPVSTISPTVNVTPITPTTYTVIGSTSAGCFTSPSVISVSVAPLATPTLVPTNSVSCSMSALTITAIPANPLLSYTWSPTASIAGANNTESIVAQPTSTAPITYTVIVSNGACVATATTQIIVQEPPVGNFITLNNDTVCKGGCVTFSSTTTGSQPLIYEWFYQSGIGTSTVGPHPEACYPSAGSFSVMMVVSNGCGIDTVVKNNFVTVFDYPYLVVGGDTTINIGQSAEIYASGGINYLWSPDLNGTIACTTCSSTVVQPSVTTQYIVVASNSIYCKVQDTVTVKVDIDCGDFFVPNVFSPNGDGLNDYINVHGRCILTYNLQIYNRWGEKVFETSSSDNSWDGTFRGQRMDTGVFVYKADGVSIDGQSFKFTGNITLIR